VGKPRQPTAGHIPQTTTAPVCPTPANRPIEEGTPCGKLDCLAFEDGSAALAYVLRQGSPVVLAVGEAHLQKENKGLESSTKRFETWLSALCPTARHLVLEVWLGRNDCGDQRVKEVAKAQKPVTSAQASTNQDDFVALGFAAKKVGIEPHGLVPTCEQYRDILNQGSGDVSRMLEVIATSTAETTEKLLSRFSPSEPGPLIVAYGGALHNDLAPRPGLEAASFAPRLQAFTHGRTTELDLVLREQVGTSESWTNQPWYSAYRSDAFPKHHLVYRTGLASFALFFPAQSPSK
jgi:hypothetical protein